MSDAGNKWRPWERPAACSLTGAPRAETYGHDGCKPRIQAQNRRHRLSARPAFWHSGCLADLYEPISRDRREQACPQQEGISTCDGLSGELKPLPNNLE